MLVMQCNLVCTAELDWLETKCVQAGMPKQQKMNINNGRRCEPQSKIVYVSVGTFLPSRLQKKLASFMTFFPVSEFQMLIEKCILTTTTTTRKTCRK